MDECKPQYRSVLHTPIYIIFSVICKFQSDKIIVNSSDEINSVGHLNDIKVR